MRFRGRLVAVGIVMIFNIMRYFYYHVYFKLPFEPSFFILTIIFVSIAWWGGKQYDRAKFYSEKDSLTNTYNRRTIEKIFPQLITSKNKVAVIMIDLDDFKEINDRYGHQQGDLVLQDVSASLQKIGGGNSLVARWGGDEFVLIYPFIENGSVNKIMGELQTTEIRDTAMSVGYAVYPEDGKTLETLIRKADQAMYKEKNKFIKMSL